MESISSVSDELRFDVQPFVDQGTPVEGKPPFARQRQVKSFLPNLHQAALSMERQRIQRAIKRFERLESVIRSIRAFDFDALTLRQGGEFRDCLLPAERIQHSPDGGICGQMKMQ